MNLIDCIWEDSHHSNLPSSNIYSKLNEQFIKKIHTKSPQSIEEIISECKSELDFVQRFRKYFQWTVPPCDSYNGKSYTINKSRFDIIKKHSLNL